MTVLKNKAFNYHHNFIPNKSNENVNKQKNTFAWMSTIARKYSTSTIILTVLSLFKHRLNGKKSVEVG